MNIYFPLTDGHRELQNKPFSYRTSSNYLRFAQPAEAICRPCTVTGAFAGFTYLLTYLIN